MAEPVTQIGSAHFRVIQRVDFSEMCKEVFSSFFGGYLVNSMQSALIAAGLVDPNEDKIKEAEAKEKSERRKKRVKADKKRGSRKFDRAFMKLLTKNDYDSGSDEL